MHAEPALRREELIRCWSEVRGAEGKRRQSTLGLLLDLPPALF
jgi:hypothetical protein